MDQQERNVNPKQKSFFKSLKCMGLTEVECQDLLHEFSANKTSWTDKRFCFEIAHEVCNKVGGIYQVIRSKAATTCEEIGNNYTLIGPYSERDVQVEVDVLENLSSPYAEPIQKMRERGVKVITGRWLIDGYPNVILFDIAAASSYLNEWRHELFEKTKINVPFEDREVNDTIIFGGLVAWFLGEFAACTKRFDPMMVAHFHEWLSGVGLLLTRTRHLPVATIFTTHATLLGRHLCAGNVDFYNNLDSFDLDKEAGTRGFYHRYCIERASTHCAHTFTTVSRITALEAMHLLKREANILTPNGLSVSKFAARHEFQNLHARYKENINNFVRGHFHGHYDFDLSNTLYFFISGRYEFTNKGGDLFIEALARLNYRLQVAHSNKTVVVFIVFPTKTTSFNVETLRGQAIAKQIRDTVNGVQQRIGERLYESCMRGEVPTTKLLLDQTDVVNLKRSVLATASTSLPPVCTHNVVDDHADPVLNAIRRTNLFNNRSDRVKVIFHPEFISSTNPLFGIDYADFVRGCHLGIFPSYYEPWGYTPAECTVMGIPSVTTNLSGFGSFMQEHIASRTQDYGIYIVDRRYQGTEASVNQLADVMFDFAQQTQRERISQRNRTERLADMLDWKILGLYYARARLMAMQEAFPERLPTHTRDDLDRLFEQQNRVMFPKRPRSVAASSHPDGGSSRADTDDDDDDISDDDEVNSLTTSMKSCGVNSPEGGEQASLNNTPKREKNLPVLVTTGEAGDSKC